MKIHARDRTRREREDRIGRELSGEFSGVQILRRAFNFAAESVEAATTPESPLRSHAGSSERPTLSR